MERNINEIKCQNCKAKAREELRSTERKIDDLKMEMASKTHLGSDGINPGLKLNDYTEIRSQLEKEKNDIIEKYQNCSCNN